MSDLPEWVYYRDPAFEIDGEPDDDDDAPESNDSDGDYVPPLDGDDDWGEDGDENA